VGTYDPSATVAGLKLDNEKVSGWISKGAQPSQTVSELIKKSKKAG
jgi:small subunit ribosomal protein S16